jgi:hypothetical protein
MKKHFQLMLFALLACCLASYAQTSVRGTVINSTNKTPMAGVSVLAKGSKTNVVTGNDGRYSISVAANTPALVFQFVGYKTQEVAIGGRGTINIELEETATALNDVMVVAYGTTKKNSYTGSASTIKQEISNMFLPLHFKMHCTAE